MRMKISGAITAVFFLLVAGSLSLTLQAGNTTMGPDWDEDSNGGRDAGNTKGTAQEVKLATTNQVATITGKLKGQNGNLAGGEEPDYQDVYAVAITDPTTFEIRTTSPGGFSEFNSALFVFDSDGRPLLANRIAEQGTPSALVSNISTDGSFKIEQPGLIYIAIAGRDSFPLDEDGNIAFAFTNDLTDIVGPSQKFPSPLAGWTTGDPGDVGSYVIKLSSVGPIPPFCGAPNAGPCFQPNPLPFCSDVSCCQRVCEEDPFCCTVTWDSTCAARAETQCTDSCGDCAGDLNGDQRIGAEDLSYLLAYWGLSDQCADIKGDGIVGGDDLTVILEKWGTVCN